MGVVARRAGRWRRRIRVPVDLACGAFAALIAGLAVAVSIAPHEGALSVLVHMAPEEPMAEIARRDPGFVFVNPAAHYDGVYFYTMALDPLLLGTEHTRIDQPANRYGHPLYGWTAAALSLGRQAALPYILVLVSILGMALAGIAASRLGSALGMTPWVGLTVGLNPGLVYAATVDTTEAFAAGLLMAAILAWVVGRRAIASVLIVLLCLAKEPLLAVPVGLAAWEVLRLARGAPRREVGRHLLLLAPGPLLFAAWYGYVRVAIGAWPFEQAPDRLAAPFLGWIDTFHKAASLATGDFFEMQSGQASVALLAVTLGAILVGIVAALRLRTPVDPISLLSGALLLCLGWLPLLYPKDLIRIAAFWLLLLPFVLLPSRREEGEPAAMGADGAPRGGLSPGSSGTGTGR